MNVLPVKVLLKNSTISTNNFVGENIWISLFAHMCFNILLLEDAGKMSRVTPLFNVLGIIIAISNCSGSSNLEFHTAAQTHFNPCIIVWICL